MILAAAVGFALLSSAFAHHGNATYDTDKKVTINGTVTKWVWSNPHCLILVDADDESGQVQHWVLETENPSSMIRSGWTKDSVKVGDQVSVVAMPVKSGGSVGRIVEVQLPNGRKLMGRGTPPSAVKPEP
jgi:hypothetical protein